MKHLPGTLANPMITTIDRDVINISVEQKHLTAILGSAPIPSDDSEEAQWGREFLQEIHKFKTAKEEETGLRYVIHFHPRRYDGEIL